MTSEAQKKASKKWNDTVGTAEYIKFRIYRNLYDMVKVSAEKYHFSVNEFLTEILAKYDQTLTK